jgi:tetratricopeptide (TPR) repeat protein
MMVIKTIFQGRLDFGSDRSFQRVRDMYVQRVVNFYRSDVFIKEDAFDEESSSLLLPKFIAEGNKRTWENSLKALRYIADFAVAGTILAFITDKGQAKAREVILPNPERSSMKAFLEGRALIEAGGTPAKAMEKLTEAISKYEKNAHALERRAYLHYVLGEYDKAMDDLNASIQADPYLAEAYLNRALVKKETGLGEDALEDFQAAIKNSVPLRPLFWKARRMKGDCHMNLGDSRSAITEFKYFCARTFSSDDENYNWKRYAYMRYGEGLLSEGKAEEALKVLNEALKLEHKDDKVSVADILLLRGIAMKQANRPGFVGALKEAAKAGSAKAADLLVAATA